VTSYIPAELRRSVEERANRCCEYCLVAEEDSYLSHEVDHIIADKHRGSTSLENLCLSCFECNRYKSSDISSFDFITNAVVPLFHPRTMQWDAHFKLDGAVITPLTSEGRVTEFLLRLNKPDRITKREALIEQGRYPCVVKT
jgi:hypothetical protein